MRAIMAWSRYGHDVTLLQSLLSYLSMETLRVHLRHMYTQGTVIRLLSEHVTCPVLLRDLELQGSLALSWLMPYDPLMFAFLYHALFSLYLSLSTRFYIRILTPSTTRWLMQIRRLIQWKIQAHDESAIERFYPQGMTSAVYHEICLHADPPTRWCWSMQTHAYNFNHTSDHKMILCQLLADD